jgi:hypothetical protein
MEMKLENLKDLIGFLKLMGLSRVFKLIPTPHNVVMGCMGAFDLKQNLKYNKNNVKLK